MMEETEGKEEGREVHLKLASHVTMWAETSVGVSCVLFSPITNGQWWWCVVASNHCTPDLFFLGVRGGGGG